MEIWTALIILQVISNTISPMPSGPAKVTVGSEDSKSDPAITLDVHSPITTKVDRITGVEADTYINIPQVTTITFQSVDLCQKAVDVMQKQDGVHSVSCVRTQ